MSILQPNEDSNPLGDPPDGDLESTAKLVVRARNGSKEARNELFRRHLPAFQRWAHGRLPSYARDIYETGDLVQETLIKSLSKLDTFEPRRPGAFLAYLRQILVNKLRDEIRRVKRRPDKKELPENLRARSPSPLEHVIDEETFERYERALGMLPELTREAIIMRIDLGLTYQEVADAIDAPSPNAARMRISRGLVEIWGHMK